MARVSRPRTALVLGATGDVGQGVTAALLESDFRVIASSRSAEKLGRLSDRLARPEWLHTVEGSVAREAGAAELLAAVRSVSGELDLVVCTISAPDIARPLSGWSADELLEILDRNLISHFVAAKSFLPLVTDGGMYLAIGGGLADFLKPDTGHQSMGQAAQRMMIRALAEEYPRISGRDVRVRELMLMGGVCPFDETPGPGTLSPLQIGRHIRTIIQTPAEFPDTILRLKAEAGAAPDQPKQS